MNQESNKQITIMKNMVVGETTFLHTEDQSDEVVEGRIAWSSDDPEVATVNPHSGLVTAQQAGETLLYATDMDSSEIVEKYSLTVERSALIEKITVEPSTLTLDRKQTYTLTTDIADSSNVEWCSSNCYIARVNRYSGKVTAKCAGRAKIIAKAQDGSGVRGHCNLIVNESGTFYYIVNKSTGYSISIDGTINVSANVKGDHGKKSNMQIWRIDNASATNDCYLYAARTFQR